MGCEFRLENKTLIITGSGVVQWIPEKLKRQFTSVVFDGEFTEIGNDAFFECFGLESIEIPNGVKRIGDFAFYRCNSLKNVTIPDGLEEIKRCAFYRCTDLESINMPDSVIEIGTSAFFECNRL